MEVYRRIYVRKSRFTAPLTRRRKTREFLAIRRVISLNKTFVSQGKKTSISNFKHA